MASKENNAQVATAQKAWSKPDLKRLGTIADVSAVKTGSNIQGNFT